MALIGIVLDLSEPGGMAAYDLDDFRVAMTVQYLFWGIGIAQMIRYRRKGIAHLQRLHPGAVETMKRGEPFVHPGFADRVGLSNAFKRAKGWEQMTQAMAERAMREPPGAGT